MEVGCSEWMLQMMLKRWKLEKNDIFFSDTLIDFSAFWQIIKYPEFKPYTGDILYAENFKAVQREIGQAENIKFIIQF